MVGEALRTAEKAQQNMSTWMTGKQKAQQSLPGRSQSNRGFQHPKQGIFGLLERRRARRNRGISRSSTLLPARRVLLLTCVFAKNKQAHKFVIFCPDLARRLLAFLFRDDRLGLRKLRVKGLRGLGFRVWGVFSAFLGAWIPSVRGAGKYA